MLILENEILENKIVESCHAATEECRSAPPPPRVAKLGEGLIRHELVRNWPDRVSDSTRLGSTLDSREALRALRGAPVELL